MWHFHSWYEHVRHFLDRGHFQRNFWVKTFHVFDSIWRPIQWFWVTVVVALIVGVLGNFVYSDVTTSKMDFTDPRTWTITHFFQANAFWMLLVFISAALLTLVSLWAHRRHTWEVREGEMNEYILKRVDHLNPNDFIFRYVRQIYVSRGEDITAREILREAAADNSSSQRPLGICILGRPTQGKTRLAWEAMQAELSTWTFIMWPYEQKFPFDFTDLRGKRFVLWLDDIHKFANAIKASALNDIRRQFANAGIPFVIVATSRDGDDKVQAHKYLGDFLERLTEIHLTDLSEQETTDLLSQMKQHKTILQQKGVDAQLAQFDGTPGSLLLGVRRMREQRYPRLPNHAKQILRAMKLLYSAGIYSYPAFRVRQTAVDIFGFDEQNWQDARNTLIAASFVRLGSFTTDYERILDPVADIYLEQAISDYPADGASVTDEWFKLRESLIRHTDTIGLLGLGTACRF